MKRAIFIGQAMPRYKSHPHDWPTLNKWLYSVGISDDEIRKHFIYSALVNYFPGIKDGGHRIPTSVEISIERKRLAKELAKHSSEIIVPIGKLSISYCLGQKSVNLTETVGKIYKLDPYRLMGKPMTIIPLPHPSGASTWHNKIENKKLLHLALDLLAKHIRS